MGRFKVGDIVARKSYGCDILFKVSDIKNCVNEDDLTLKGITCRIEADAPESDLLLQTERQIKEYMRSQRVLPQKYSNIGIRGINRILKKASYKY